MEKNAKETYGMIQTAFGPSWMIWASVFEWHERFKEGRESVRVSDISTRIMHQSTTPSLSQTIWPKWASRQFLSLPIFQTLLPVTFGYSLSSEAVVMKRWVRLWRRSLTRSHKRTSLGPSRIQQVHCSRRRLLQRGVEFHVCTINKSAPTNKVW